MTTIILLCNENHAPNIRQDIQSAKEKLRNGEVDLWEWSVGDRQSIKVGHRVYIQRTHTYPPAGYFAAGYVVPARTCQPSQSSHLDSCYCNERFENKLLVQIAIDSVIDYDSPLELSDLEQRTEFIGARFSVKEGCLFDEVYVKKLDNAWEQYLTLDQSKGIHLFTSLSNQGYKRKRLKDYNSAFEIYYKALGIAKNINDLSWTDFFNKRLEELINLPDSATLKETEISVVEIFPDEVKLNEVFYEGAVRQVLINDYERNSSARQECIQHYGCGCCICGYDFSKVFGELGEGFIHVHHLKPLSEIKREYEVDPIEDLRPVCPNCHAMIHREKRPLSIDQVKNKLNTEVWKAVYFDQLP